MSRVFMIVALVGLVSFASAWAQTVRVINPTGREYADEFVRVDLQPTGGQMIVREGRSVPFQREKLPGGSEVIWIRDTFPAETTHEYKLAERPGSGGRGKPLVLVGKHNDGRVVMDSGTLKVVLPASSEGGQAPGPIASLGWPGQDAATASRWETDMAFQKLTATVLADGELFGKVRLRYEFAGKAGIEGDTPAFAEIDVTVRPGLPFAIIEERHEMTDDSAWVLDATEGWDASESELQPHHVGASGRGPRRFGTQPLTQGQIPYQKPELLLNLFPRWNQHYKDGWFAVAASKDTAVGALVLRASQWYWPHQNAIEALVPAKNQMLLRCPTWKGKRLWLLMAGTRENVTGKTQPHPRRKGKTVTVGGPKQVATRYGYESLDTINHEYPLLTWPGAKGNWSGYWPLTGNINPTGFWRGLGRQALGSAGKTTQSVGALTHTQVLLHPDTYGSYWLYWSPENPNFYSDFIKVPVGKAAQLREHPQFKVIRDWVESRVHEDLYHSVTLPGGAGQECPGYLSHGLHQWQAMAGVCKKYFDFDITEWPRYKAAHQFLYKVSQPNGGGGRLFHPGGDTHPGKSGPKSAEAFKFGDPRKWTTEELPGFGVVLRNNCGTGDETYMAFKSGPNRGHYHGDQLSFHLAFNAKAVAVDHHCSYAPRAGQEHMHNRVSFATDKLPTANMDGYERVIALKTSGVADVTIGQVQSDRLRAMAKLPPENWHQEWPLHTFKSPLTYRRTIVLVKGGKQDYFVIRDQYAGPDPVKATWNLHAYTGSCKRDGRDIKMGKLGVFVAHPSTFDFDTFSWSHSNGGGEKTLGPKLTISGTSGEFITVVHPGGVSAEAIDGGVRVGTDEVVFGGNAIDDADGTTYVTVRREGKVAIQLTGKDIDMDRSQGEIGLFVPDAGYPFGQIPDWLVRQRDAVPDWAPKWVHELRGK